MRASTSAGRFRAKAIAGTRAVMIALNCDNDARKGLLGFAFRRQRVDADPEPRWLRSLKVFESVVPKPDLEKGDYRTNEFPIQSFLWSDYTADPGTTYKFEIFPAFGRPGGPELGDRLKLEVTTEFENDGRHGIWFNRGAIASQAYARQFQNHKPTDEEMNNPNDKHTKWLSRGLLEACLEYINTTKRSEALRACIYEFTYAPIIEAFKKKVDDGFDVKLIVHDDKKGENRKAIKRARLDLMRDGERIVIWRTRPPIPHNKLIVKLEGDNATSAPAKARVAEISSYPPALVKQSSMTCIFSPRATASMLNWYADRMSDATSSIMFTAAFTVADDFIEPLGRKRDFLRFVLKEKPPTPAERKALEGDRDLVISYGAVLGAAFRVKEGKIVATRKVKIFPLDRWFLKEELTREQGNIFFVHTKYLLIDPLSEDPLICTGSANFSANSLTSNDENMVLIRGSTRVADIYMTEFDRLFRHFYFSDVANEVEMKRKEGERPEKVLLDENDKWTDSYFYPGGFKSRRREMFFDIPTANWTVAAGKHSNDEPVRPKKKKKAKAAKATPAKAKKAKKKKKKKKKKT